MSKHPKPKPYLYKLINHLMVKQIKPYNDLIQKEKKVFVANLQSPVEALFTRNG